ncbi:FtsK/SpoIIIE domain-containing protein [Gordonia aichiensis]|uniref:FtsK/SpoIIIE domain-containing protein n=1 Tax=Gordonia aichiensis TaxID=36820 RepID=UPI003267909B
MSDWFTLTFIQDRQKLAGPITPTLLNWMFLAVIGVIIYASGFTLTIAAVTGGWFLITLLRSAYVQRRRRTQVAGIFESLAPAAKWPSGTATRPAVPSNHIKKIRWGAGALPEQFSVTLNSASPAAVAPLLRGGFEVIIEGLPHSKSKQGGEWLFTWNKSTLTATAVDHTDPRLVRKLYERRITALVAQNFAVRMTAAAATGWAVEVKDWAQAESATGETVEYPTGISVRCADRDLTDLALRDKVERLTERAIPVPGEWLFTWDASASMLSVDHTDRDSLEAQRKRTQRRMSDDINALSPARGKDPVILEVVEWVGPEQALPRHLHVSFGTLALDDPRKKDQIEDGFDAAVVNRWPEARSLLEWHHGATTELDITLVAKDDPRALRRVALTRFRNVVDSKFGTSRNAVTTEVLEWQPDLSAVGTALPQKARVHFGTVDVTKSDTRDQFQDHWDSIDDANDWHYEWNTPEGYVEIKAVPPLPQAFSFPGPGTPEFDEYIRLFREGKIVIGEQKGGGTFVWNLNEDPHGLIGGKTGQGKSVTLDEVIFLSMWCHDMVDLVICDPKRSDFTWTPEFPNVVEFAAGATEIVDAIDYLASEMDRRQGLLQKYPGTRNMRYLRRLYKEHPEYEAEDGPAPKRLIMIFDEIANWWMKSDDSELEELKGRARTQMEGIGQLARALEINVLTAAQKPDKNRLSTQLKENLGFRLCVGRVNGPTSEQILDSNHGTRFPSKRTPKGRGWAYTSGADYQVVQIPYLPNADELCPWDPSVKLRGTRDLIREKLKAEGYVQIHEPNASGGMEPRWVTVEGSETARRKTDSEQRLVPADFPADAGDKYLVDDELTDDTPNSQDSPFGAGEELWDDPPWDTDENTYESA